MIKNPFLYDVVVVGAGPSGILALSYLLADHTQGGKNILWIDPQFKVGDFGTKWGNVPSNTKVKGFIKFIEKCFGYDPRVFNEKFKIFQLHPEGTCFLKEVTEPLAWITDRMIKKVSSIKGYVSLIESRDGIWEIKLSNGGVTYAKNIILAQGSDPIQSSNKEHFQIPLEIALNQKKLENYCEENDRIAVFGSSHSAVLALKNLIEIDKFKHIINFYRSPLRYAVYMDSGEILFDNTGLKGEASEFAKHHLENNTNQKLSRILNTEENREKHLSQCSKVINAVGFQPREINFSGMNVNQYNPETGVITKGLYGLGIAFPSLVLNCLGEVEKNIGLLKFVYHLDSIFPIWKNTFKS